MFRCMSIAFNKLAQKISVVAEWSMWTFIGVSVAKTVLSGVVNLSSALIAVLMSLSLIAFAFYLLAFSCRIISNLINEKK